MPTRPALILPRRRFLLQASAGSLGGLAGILAHARAPAVVTADKARPGFPSGVQNSDVHGHRGIVWARSDRPARRHREDPQRRRQREERGDENAARDGAPPEAVAAPGRDRRRNPFTSRLHLAAFP